MLNLIIVISSICLGFILSFFIYKLIRTKRENNVNLKSNIKSELDNLMFEKSIALEALDKIDYYYKEKKIDDFEKDRLLLKYTKLLENYDNKIFKLRPVLEMQEIYQYRNQLFSLLTEYISKIDSKLSVSSKNLVNIKGYDKYEFDKKKILNPNLNVNLNNLGDLDAYNNANLENPLTQKNVIKNNLDNDINNYRHDDIFKLTDRNDEYFNNLNQLRQNGDDDRSTLKNVEDDKDNKDLNTFDININEIDRIQKDILNTLKRLDES